MYFCCVNTKKGILYEKIITNHQCFFLNLHKSSKIVEQHRVKYIAFDIILYKHPSILNCIDWDIILGHCRPRRYSCLRIGKLWVRNQRHKVINLAQHNELKNWGIRSGALRAIIFQKFIVVRGNGLRSALFWDNKKFVNLFSCNIHCTRVRANPSQLYISRHPSN